MIGTLSVKIAAHNPSFPLEPVFTFVNSAQSFRIMNVPRKIGRWDITKVFVNLEYPDTTTVRKECVLNGSVWVGTVDGCATSGTSTNGFIVTASGIDEDGNAVSNYVLGAGDLYVQKLDGSITPDQNAAKMFFYEETPTTPKEGDTTFIQGTLNIWDGTAWTPVAQVPTKTSDLTNDSGFITLAQVPTPSFIEDTNENKINADRTVEIAQQSDSHWTITDGTNTYTLTGSKTNASWDDDSSKYSILLSGGLWALTYLFKMGSIWVTSWQERIEGSEADTNLTFPSHSFNATWEVPITQDVLALKSELDVKRDLSDMKVKGVPQNTKSWFSIKYGTTTENAYYYDEGRWETGETLRVLTAQATIYTLQKSQESQWTNIGEFQLDNNSEATVTYDGTTYSITGYVGEIVVSNELPTKTSDLTNDSGFVTSSELETSLELKQDKLSEAQMDAINQDANAYLTKFYVQGESQMYTFIASSTLSKSDFAAQGVYDTTTGTWTKNITAVQTGTNVTTLESNLFKDVTTMTYFEGPELTFGTLGAQAFGGCTGLQTLKLPKVRSVPINFCKDCTALRNLTIPASVISIGRNAFLNCSNL